MKDFYIPTIKEILDESAERFGDRVFIKYIKDDVIVEKSYKTVRRDTLAVARFLRSVCGGKKHIAVLGKGSYEYIVFMLAVIVSGNVLVPLAPEISAEEASRLIAAADVDAFVYGKSFLDRAKELDRLCPSLYPILNCSDPGLLDAIIGKYSSTGEFANILDFEVDKDECCAIVFTSGTTGKKKGVMLSTKSIVGNISYSDRWDVLAQGACTLSVLPMHHLYCFSGDVIRNLRDGVTLCLNGEIRDLQKNIIRFEPTTMRVVPLIAQSLIQRYRVAEAKNPDLSVSEVAALVFGRNLKQMISGAAYLDPEMVDEYKKIGIKILQGYGMTEAGCRIAVPDENAPRGSVGKLIDICTARTVGGEIQVHTPSIMLGYYKNDEKTQEHITPDGWLRTGDIGEVTPDGYVMIHGRLKNLIILSGGENVSPEAIEKKFADFPPIAEIRVSGENDKLVADIYPDFEYCRLNNIPDCEKIISERVREVNAKAKPSHIIASVRFSKEPLEKTESGKIKRKRIIIGKEK